MTTSRDYTTDEITDAIGQALHDHEIAVIPALIKMLALRDPGRAQEVYDTLKLGADLHRLLGSDGAGQLAQLLDQRNRPQGDDTR